MLRRERQLVAEGKDRAIPLGEFAAKLAAKRSGQVSSQKPAEGTNRELKPGEIPP